MFYLWTFTFSRYDFLPKWFPSVHEFQEAWFSLKTSRHLVFTLIQKSSCAWHTDTIMSRNLNWFIKKIILYICIAGLSSKTPTRRENCSLISIILSIFPRNVNYCYCCYQQRQQRRLAIMTSKLRNEIIHSVNYIDYNPLRNFSKSQLKM